MAPYQRLKAWKHSKALAVECAKITKTFPDFEQEGLAEQLRRAAYRIPINIAEGSARRGTPEYRAALDAARASHAEVVTILEIAKDLEYIPLVRYAKLDALADETGKTLFGLLRKISDARVGAEPASEAVAGVAVTTPRGPTSPVP